MQLFHETKKLLNCTTKTTFSEVIILFWTVTYPEFFWQTGTHMIRKKAPPLLAKSQEIFKICASRYSKNALPGSVF